MQRFNKLGSLVASIALAFTLMVGLSSNVAADPPAPMPTQSRAQPVGISPANPPAQPPVVQPAPNASPTPSPSPSPVKKTSNTTTSTTNPAVASVTTQTTAPSPLPAPAPISGSNPTNTRPPDGNFQVPNGPFWAFPYSVFLGDMIVNGVKQYDSDPTTGLIVVVKKQVVVEAPSGAGAKQFSVEADADAFAVQQQAIMQQHGCAGGNGCSGGVTIFTWNPPAPNALPSARPSSFTPPTTITPRPANGNFSVAPNATVNVYPFAVLLGDVTMNGIRFFDNDPTTGSIVIVYSPAWVTAPSNGLSGKQFSNAADAEAFAAQQKQIMENVSGCNGKCTGGVTVFPWYVAPLPSRRP